MAQKYGRLAQLVEQLIYTEKVTGSSPVSPTQQHTFVMANKHFDTERGPVGAMHLWVIVALIIVAVAVSLMVPQLRGQLFGAAVVLYNSVAPTF